MTLLKIKRILEIKNMHKEDFESTTLNSQLRYYNCPPHKLSTNFDSKE